MGAIYRRELKSYAHSFVGALFVSVVLCMVSIYFIGYNMLSGSNYLGYALQSVSFIFMIAVPILTMRILSEERRQKTDQLILTAPVNVWQIVLGKYLALVTIFAIPTAIVATYPLIIRHFGGIDVGKSYTAVAAFFLYGLACLAVSMFVSSLTESQVIAAVVSFGILFIGYMMGGICAIISQTGNIVTRILSCFDLYTNYTDMFTGTLKLTNVLFFLTIVVLFLIFTVQSIQKRRYEVSRKTISLSAFSGTIIIVSIAVAVLVNWAVTKIPTTYTVFDVTKEHLFDISDQTRDYIDGMSEDVTIYVLASEDAMDTTVKTTLNQYEDLGKHVSVEYIDTTTNPKFYTKYSDSAITDGSLIVESSKRFKIVNYNDLYAQEMNYETYGFDVTGYDGEGQITSALIYVTSDDMPKLYTLTGHGEATIAPSFMKAIEKANMATESINLMDVDAVPEDAEGLIIFAPASDLSDDDTAKLDDYIQRGGKLFISMAFVEKTLPNFSKVLSEYGVKITDGVVCDPGKGNFYQSPFYLLPSVESTTLTTGIAGKYYVFAPYAQGLSYEETEGVSVSELMSTSDESFARADVESEGSLEMKDGDVAGPFFIGLSCSKTIGDKTSEAIIISSANMFTDEADSMVSGANMTLFSNVVTSFADDEVAAVSIPPKSFSENTVVVPQSTYLIVGLITVILVPLVILIAGFAVWFTRRKK